MQYGQWTHLCQRLGLLEAFLKKVLSRLKKILKKALSSIGQNVDEGVLIAHTELHNKIHLKS